MILAVHQPQYLPWSGYFDKMDRADCFCYLDNVQFKKNEWQNRNRIKTAAGWQWLSVPVHYRFPRKINEVKISRQSDWQRKHLQALISNYSKSPYFEKYMPFFREVYSAEWESCSRLNICITEQIRRFLRIEDTATCRASDFQLREDPNERLTDLCTVLGADTYLAGAGGKNYMNLKPFREQGIRVIFQDFRHPVYPQLFGDFQSHLSVLDILFNCGPESMNIIREANSRKGKR